MSFAIVEQFPTRAGDPPINVKLIGGITIGSSGPVTELNPTVPDSASTTLLAGGLAQTFLKMQNNSTGLIMVSWSGGILTDIVPSATNIGEVVAPGEVVVAPFIPTGNVTVYQKSGSTVNNIYVAYG